MRACSSGEAGFSGPNSSSLTMTVGSPGPGRRWGVGDRRQLEPPVLLGLVVRVGRGLRRSAPVERTRPPHPAAGPDLGGRYSSTPPWPPPSWPSSRPSPWWLIIVDHPLATTPLATRCSASVGRLQRRNRQPVVGGPTPGDLGDLGALVGAEGRRAAAPVARVERVEPVGVEVVNHVADPVRGWCR